MGQITRQINLFKPSMGEEEVEAVKQVLLSGWTGLGPKTKEFEDKFSEYLSPEGNTKSVAVNSCTAALDLSMRLLNIGYGDEVIIPAITFISTAHVVSYAHATPIFADIDEDTLLLSKNDMLDKITKRTKAIIPVHYGGRMVDIPDLINAFFKTKRQDLKIVEDCAHACGSSLGNKKPGTLGDIGCFSFQAVKNLSTGDGGMLVSANNDHILRAKKLRWLGIDKGTWDRAKTDYSYWWDYSVEEVGLKCSMNDINAAIGIVQLGKLDTMNARRKSIANIYTQELKDLDIKLPVQDTDKSFSSWHIYHIQTKARDRLFETLLKQGISTGVHYRPLHLYSCYGNKPHLPIAEKIWQRLLSLPMHPSLTDDDVQYIIKAVRVFYGRE